MKHTYKKTVTPNRSCILSKLRTTLKSLTTSKYVMRTKAGCLSTPSHSNPSSSVSSSAIQSFKSKSSIYSTQLQVAYHKTSIRRAIAKLHSLENTVMKINMNNILVRSECECILIGQESKDAIQPYRIITTVCDECESAIKKDYVTNMFVCTSCGKSRSLLDCSQDLIKNKQRPRYVYSRRPLYKKYLTQFSENTADPPDEVLVYVKRNLWNTHTLSLNKAKMTPVIQILSKSKYKAYTWMAARIIKLLSGKPVPILPTTLIDTMTNRFVTDFSGIGNFSYISHRLLCLEGHSKLAQHFSYMKTRDVLRQHDRIFLSKCIENRYNMKKIHPLI